MAARLELEPQILVWALIAVVVAVALNGFFRALPTGLEPESLHTGTHGSRALHCAARRGHLSLVEALIENGVDCDARDEKGRTPLMLAAAAGQEAAVKRLLRAGARTDPVSPTGDTALDLAVRAGHESVAALLAGAAPVAVATASGA